MDARKCHKTLETMYKFIFFPRNYSILHIRFHSPYLSEFQRIATFTGSKLKTNVRSEKAISLGETVDVQETLGGGFALITADKRHRSEVGFCLKTSIANGLRVGSLKATLVTEVGLL